MSDFTSDFWSWWIIAIVVGAIVFCIWLLLANRKSTLPAGGTAEATGHVWDEDLEELNNPLPRWWIMKFYITIVFGIAYLALYPGLGTFEGVLGWTEKGQYEAEIAAADNKYGPLYDRYMNLAIPEVAADEDAMKMGERLYVNYCAVCHGSDARGATGFPNTRTHPSPLRIPFRCRISVDFPAPFGPTSPSVSPSSIRSETPRSAGEPSG